MSQGMGKGIPRIELEGSALICCTRNRPGRLSELLQNLTKLQDRPGLLIIVDSSDSDESKLVCENPPGPISVIWLPSEPGAPHQKNVGLDYLKSLDFEWSLGAVFFLDDDIEPNKDYFTNAVSLLNRFPHVDILGGFDTTLPGSGHESLIRRLLWLDGSQGGKLLKSGLCTTVKPLEELVRVDWVPGGMQTYRGAVIKDQRFDGRIRIYGDEVELQTRLVVGAGVSIFSSSLLGVIHHGETIAKDNQAISESYMDGFRWSLAQRYPRRVSKSIVILSTVVLMIGELIFGTFTKSSSRLQKSLGHLIFLSRLILRRNVQQFVTHRGSGPYAHRESSS